MGHDLTSRIFLRMVHYLTSWIFVRMGHCPDQTFPFLFEWETRVEFPPDESQPRQSRGSQLTDKFFKRWWNCQRILLRTKLRGSYKVTKVWKSFDILKGLFRVPKKIMEKKAKPVWSGKILELCRIKERKKKIKKKNSNDTVKEIETGPPLPCVSQLRFSIG